VDYIEFEAHVSAALDCCCCAEPNIIVRFMFVTALPVCVSIIKAKKVLAYAVPRAKQKPAMRVDEP